MEINLQTSGHCSWDNYQGFLSVVAEVQDIMRDYYKTDEIDLLDAHSFLWTINLDVLKTETAVETVPKRKRVEIGAIVYHKDYGEGIIRTITDEKVYVSFDNKQRIFPYPEAFEKEYLKLI